MRPARRRLSAVGVAILLAVGTAGCVNEPTMDAPTPASAPAADQAELQALTDDFKEYMNDNFGDGYGQEPVSWYSKIKSIEFVAPDALVIKTSLSASDGEAVKSIATAVDMYSSEDPASIQIFGEKGEKLFEY